MRAAFSAVEVGQVYVMLVHGRINNKEEVKLLTSCLFFCDRPNAGRSTVLLCRLWSVTLSLSPLLNVRLQQNFDNYTPANIKDQSGPEVTIISYYRRLTVSWSLTSPFSTNMAISETNYPCLYLLLNSERM